MRIEYTMTQEQLDVLLEASRPPPAMFGGALGPPLPKERAYAAWQQLGAELGFKWDTARPMPGCCDKHFTAEPMEDASTR